jgi:hypothetical protein
MSQLRNGSTGDGAQINTKHAITRETSSIPPCGGVSYQRISKRSIGYTSNANPRTLATATSRERLLMRSTP